MLRTEGSEHVVVIAVDAGLLSLFEPEFIVSAKEVAAGKPAPDVYLECLRRLGCSDNSRCVACTAAICHVLLCRMMAVSDDDKCLSNLSNWPKPSRQQVLDRTFSVCCRAMVIEDAVHGLRAAKAAGTYAVGIANSLPRAMLADEADLVIESLVGFSPEAVPRASK